MDKNEVKHDCIRRIELKTSRRKNATQTENTNTQPNTAEPHGACQFSKASKKRKEDDELGL